MVSVLILLGALFLWATARQNEEQAAELDRLNLKLRLLRNAGTEVTIAMDEATAEKVRGMLKTERGQRQVVDAALTAAEASRGVSFPSMRSVRACVEISRCSEE